MIENLISYLRNLLLIIHLWYYKKSPSKEKIKEDVNLWLKKMNKKSKSDIDSLSFLLFKSKTFRNLFYFRVKNFPKLCKLIYPQQQNLIIQKDMVMEGGSLYFYHPFCTIINAKYIGKNCIIRHLTTIGNKGENQDEKPTILNNVNIGANAIIIGDITIGNNVIIGAGAVVTKSIPDNCVVAGNPACIIKKIN